MSVHVCVYVWHACVCMCVCAYEPMYTHVPMSECMTLCEVYVHECIL